jgi:hypothetical protein
MNQTRKEKRKKIVRKHLQLLLASAARVSARFVFYGFSFQLVKKGKKCSYKLLLECR